ncbi:MAG: hypothetical protein AAGG48_16780 [Planctomycetota bacterium]
MSVLNVERPSRRVVERDQAIELPSPVQDTLNIVIRQNRRADAIHFVAVAIALGLLVLLGCIVADVLLSVRLKPIRWAIWVTAIGATSGAVWAFFVRTRRRLAPLSETRLVDAAWKIEASHPAMEERLTSTVQFLRDDSNQHASPQLVGALFDETTQGVRRIDTESIPTRSTRLPITMAAVLAVALLFSVALWPQAVLTSLGNLATPWCAYRVPILPVKIDPGDVTIAEGESLKITAAATDALDRPTLEIIRGDAVESHLMEANSPEVATLTMTDVKKDALYRIHSGGLYSTPHTITIHPRPQLSGVTADLAFPDYTFLDPQTMDRLIDPIEVPVGTEVKLTVNADDVAVDAFIDWTSEQQRITARKVSKELSVDAPQFAWTIKVEPTTDLSGTLVLQSEHGVQSVPLPIAIRASNDSLPRVEITKPSLRQITMQRDSDLSIHYRALDDFGLSATELMVMFDEEEPVVMPCQKPTTQANENRSGRRVWTGEASYVLANVPETSQHVSLWLRIADNRPAEFGGPQCIESEKIQITIDDQAESIGQQQISADRNMIEESLERAAETIERALVAAQDLQGDRSNPREARSEANAETVETLREKTREARQILDQLAERLQAEPNLFQPKAEEITRVADQEVAEAMELANQIPLTDELDQRDELARGSEKQLASALDQLDQLKSDIQQQAERMEKAAKLDKMASQQERLAEQASEGDQANPPEEPWRTEQQKAADEIQNFAEENEEERRQRLLRRAKEAEELAEQANQLAEQQRKLTAVMKDDVKDDVQADPRKEKLQELIADQKEQIGQPDKRGNEAQDNDDQDNAAQPNDAQPNDAQPNDAQPNDAQPNDAQPNDAQGERGQQQDGQIEQHNDRVAKKQQKRLSEAANAARDGNLDQAAAKIQEQIAERTEQIQKQAERIAKQDNINPSAKERARQAAEQLKQAKQTAEQAKQSMCEKCNGGGEDKQGAQQASKPGQQNRSLKSQVQSTQQQPQGAAQPNTEQQAQRNDRAATESKDRTGMQANDRREQKLASKQDDAKIDRDQQDTVQSLEQAAQALNQVCKSCRECANGTPSGKNASGKNPSGKNPSGKNPSGKNPSGKNPSGKNPSSKSPSAQRGNAQQSKAQSETPSEAKGLARASDGAKKAAKSASKEKATQHAKDAADQLHQLADQAARESGYTLRERKSPPQQNSDQRKTGRRPADNSAGSKPGQASTEPGGVDHAAGDSHLNGQPLRGGSNSNWTRSRRKLGGGVLDDREGNVPEQYRDVVERYFEELSRQQSKRED